MAGYSCIRKDIKECKKHMIQHSSHMIETELKIEGPGLIIIGAYAPHDDRPIEEQADFYKNVHKRCWKIPRNKELLCICDFNVRWHGRREDEVGFSRDGEECA